MTNQGAARGFIWLLEMTILQHKCKVLRDTITGKNLAFRSEYQKWDQNL